MRSMNLHASSLYTRVIPMFILVFAAATAAYGTPAYSAATNAPVNSADAWQLTSIELTTTNVADRLDGPAREVLSSEMNLARELAKALPVSLVSRHAFLSESLARCTY